MKINIYYGGRGLLEDPTIFVMNKITEVLEELRVEVTKYNLFEEKQEINLLPKTLKDADAIILATTVEWYGMGGLMQQFLDACWFYGDKENMKHIYMLPVVLATTHGERMVKNTLCEQWEMLGGLALEGMSSYVLDHVEFETNPDYISMIEIMSENLYRTVNKRISVFPNSQNSIRQNVLNTKTVDLTPQESEQLSMFIADDTYVKKQKEDIQELTSLFKEMLGEPSGTKNGYIDKLQEHFKPEEMIEASYLINIQDTGETIVVDVRNNSLNCYNGTKEEVDVDAKTTSQVMDNILAGNITFQKAFMTGEVVAKGNFKTLRSFDALFHF